MIGFRTQEQIGHKIAELRRARGWDQGQLGVRVGLEQPVISRIEHGQRGLSAQELHRLAAALDATPEAILMDDRSAPALLRSGDAEDAAVRHGLDTLDGAIRQYFAAEELARTFL